MKKCEMLYEGKAKKVYTTEDPELYIVDYKDDATAFNGLKKGTILGKGAINNRVTNHLMKMLESKGIPTHFVEQLSDRETVVKKVKIVPLEVIIRNIAAGSMSKRLGIEEGKVLPVTVLEYSSNNSKRHILWSDTLYWLSCHIDSDNAWHIDIISLGKKLLHKLRSALTHCHGSQCAISCMAV